MTKGELIQLVKYATGNMFRDRTIAIHLSLVWEQLLGQVHSLDPSQLDFYAKDFVADVVDEKPFRYALLPKKIIQFKDLKKGVRNVSDPSGKGLTYVPVTALGRRIYGSLTGGIDTTVGYEVKTDRVVFDDMPDGIGSVKLSLVSPISEWGMDDEIPMPSGVNETLIQMTVASMKGEKVPENIFKRQG